MTRPFVLPDTQPYPTSLIRNLLLLNACQLTHNSSTASRKLSSEQLRTEIRGILSQNHYINLSLAMTMAPDVGAYQNLMDSVDTVLRAGEDGEIQWLALPIVIVTGCKQDKSLPPGLPTGALFVCLQNYPYLRNLTQNTR